MSGNIIIDEGDMNETSLSLIKVDCIDGRTCLR
jgi:hypothetical protein